MQILGRVLAAENESPRDQINDKHKDPTDHGLCYPLVLSGVVGPECRIVTFMWSLGSLEKGPNKVQGEVPQHWKEC